MVNIPEFTGFPRKTLLFLKGLQENNNRIWFEEHKSDYQKYFILPSMSFVKVFGERLADTFEGIVFDASSRPGSSIMRIYRDVRFSKDKTPYNTNLRFVFWNGSGKRLQSPGFFIRLDPNGGQVMGGMYQFPKPILEKYRDAVVSDVMGKKLDDAVAQVVSKKGLELGGKHYKRIPRGYNQQHPRIEMLLYNGLYAATPKFKSSLFMKPELVDKCFEHCMNISPVYNWLVEIVE